MKRARQHGKPVPKAEEELDREIMDVAPEMTGRRRARGGAGDVLRTKPRTVEGAPTGSRLP
ncbi:hypothetical protein AB0K47_15480 [Streptomyces tirandamycinicus]|uniref:Uncharacterized protein n=1 Tax=Streptomyces tirandamycinicus TaxID=2174846 RepID=A0A2S1SMC9_9ACTN|nr:MULTISPECIES: hypothetical protein [Streptomyces]AWI27575.1 hypothetical protein DDW44_01390 [Streptomyces tirandamycinicus]MCY0984354.1 hypothetical protein [Streptomyces tirandamycinicus]NNJ05425.1 hypothetical protein [Streptomyces sp. PKU-MA01144]TFE50676.1 hypothetical protein E3E14_13835 [Streptomyces sp. ICN441]